MYQQEVEQMSLIGCFATPHPPIIVPEVGGAELRNVEPTVRVHAGGPRPRPLLLRPDTIVLLSPHAPMTTRKMGVSLASAYEGDLAYFQGARSGGGGRRPTRIWPGRMLESAAESDIPVVATASAGQTVDLDHGSMVPLVYLMGDLEQSVPAGAAVLLAAWTCRSTPASGR